MMHRKMHTLPRQLPITGSTHKATIEGDGSMPAITATFDVTAERRRPARLHRAHDLTLATAQVPDIPISIRVTVAAEDIRHLQRRS